MSLEFIKKWYGKNSKKNSVIVFLIEVGELCRFFIFSYGGFLLIIGIFVMIVFLVIGEVGEECVCVFRIMLWFSENNLIKKIFFLFYYEREFWENYYK